MTAPQPVDPASIKPARLWYWVAGALFAVSLVPGFLLAKSGAETIDLSVDVTGETIELRDEPLSVFAPEGVDPDRIDCALTAPDGGPAVPLEEDSTDLSIDDRGRVGVTPDGLPPGRYRLTCHRGVDPIGVAEFGVRSTEGWTVAVFKIVAAFVIPVFAGLVAITIFVITAVRRSEARGRLLRPPVPPDHPPPGHPPPAG